MRSFIRSTIEKTQRGIEVIINLRMEGNLPFVREMRGMSDRNIRRALEIAVENNEVFLIEWRRIHG